MNSPSSNKINIPQKLYRIVGFKQLLEQSKDFNIFEKGRSYRNFTNYLSLRNIHSWAFSVDTKVKRIFPKIKFFSRNISALLTAEVWVAMNFK